MAEHKSTRRANRIYLQQLIVLVCAGVKIAVQNRVVHQIQYVVVALQWGIAGIAAAFRAAATEASVRDGAIAENYLGTAPGGQGKPRFASKVCRKICAVVCKATKMFALLVRTGNCLREQEIAPKSSLNDVLEELIQLTRAYIAICSPRESCRWFAVGNLTGGLRFPLPLCLSCAVWRPS